MNNNTFERVVEDTLGMAQKVLIRKSGEYSSSEDKLHNFDKAKDLMRCKTKEFALLGMLNKHLVSVIDMIEKYEKTGELPTSNMIDEKIGDSINYFILLKACFYDDMIKKVAEKGCKCGCEREKEKDNKIKDYPERAMSLTEILEKNQGAIANSMYQNPRKRLVVENLRKMLKPLFVWLTDNNRFVDYEKIKGMLNRAELEPDYVTDEFIKDVIIAIEQLDDLRTPMEWYKKSDEVISEIIQFMLFPKFKVGDSVWIISSDLEEKKWQVTNKMTIVGMFLYTADKAVGYKSMFGEMVHEKYCFKTKEEAQRECDKRNKSEQDIKDMFDTASDLTTAMVVNKRKKAVVDNMQDKLKPIIEYLQIVEPKQYQYFSNLCFQEIQKHNSITDKVFYKTTIDFLNSLMLPDKDKLPQYKFKTLTEIRNIIVEQLEDDLKKM